MVKMTDEPCCGCGANLATITGPTHPYMLSSPACFTHFNTILAVEYSTPDLMRVHRLTVDTWAVQHPGDETDRRAVQSVAVHLGRLMVQLDRTLTPEKTNAIILRLLKQKTDFPKFEAPVKFQITAKDVAAFAGSRSHAEKVREWAQATWNDWHHEHARIKEWVARSLA